MNVLLLDPEKKYAEKLRGIAQTIEGAVLIDPDEAGISPSDSANIDLIIGGGSSTGGAAMLDTLLLWRCHPHTCLVPCWVTSGPTFFLKTCSWPHLTIDRFDERLDLRTFLEWVDIVAEWQQNRMQLPMTNRLTNHSPLELATSLALRKATGRLAVFDEEGGEGTFFLRNGCMGNAVLRHLKGAEAFYDFLSWTKGSYQWESTDSVPPSDGSIPIETLLDEGLNLFREANLVFHFIEDLNLPLVKTESESALDDGAVSFFEGQKELYGIIDNEASLLEVIDASPLSRIRTMSCLSKWFSLGDIEVPRADNPIAKYRLLIVDDSQLMCKALRQVFSADPRFEILGAAHDGVEALSLIGQLEPDVVTLDMQMPRMDGLTTLKHIMVRNPKPVVVVSAFTRATSRLTYESFKYGAIDVLTKPSRGNVQLATTEDEEIRNRVAQASCVRIEAARYVRRTNRTRAPNAGTGAFPTAAPPGGGFVVIICGSGGFSSLLKLFFSLNGAIRLPPILTSISLPKTAVGALLPNLERDCSLALAELVPPGGLLKPDVSYLCSPENCFHIEEDNGAVSAVADTGCNAGEHALDHLLFSLGDSFGDRASAILLSGAGNDGLEGMGYVRKKGGKTYVLSPEVCLRPDLPRRILQKGFAREVKAMAELASLLETS